MLLQILIPTFNRAELLIKHLENILNCITKYELQQIVSIMIIDNKSTDKTVAEVKSLISRFKNFDVVIDFIVNSKNIGVSKSYCKLVKLSDADYVWIQSDDDNYFLESVNEIVKIIKLNHPDMILVPTTISDASNISNLKFGGANSLDKLSAKSIKSIDKCLGFFGSVVCKKSIVSNSISMCKKKNIRLDNNYLCKIICYFSFFQSKKLKVINKIVFEQDISRGSYFYNDPAIRRDSHWDSLLEIYFAVFKSDWKISKIVRYNILNKYFDNKTYILDLRRTKYFNIKDPFEIYFKTGYITKWGILLSLFPSIVAEEISKFRSRRRLLKKMI